MESMKDALSKYFGTDLQAEDIEEYICSGCGKNVVVKQMKVLDGPTKGQLRRYNVGCICADNQQAREAMEERERRYRANGRG